MPAQSPTPVVVSPHPTEQNPDPNEKKGTYHAIPKILFVLLALIVIFAAVGTGIFLYKTTGNNKNSMMQPQAGSKNNTVTTPPTQNTNQTNPATASTTMQPNEQSSGTGQTSQWKVYENTAEKFSIPYPSTLEAHDKAYGMGVTNIQIAAPTNPNAPVYQLLTFPKVIGSTIGQDFDTYYTMADGSTKTLTGQDGISQIFTKVRVRTVGSLRGFDYKTTANPPKTNEEAEVGTYIEIGSNVVIISTAQSNRATLDTMLAGFKYPL